MEKKTLTSLMKKQTRVSFLVIHAYSVDNKRLMTVEESVHIVFDQTNHAEQKSVKNRTKEDDQNITLQKLELCIIACDQEGFIFRILVVVWKGCGWGVFIL